MAEATFGSRIRQLLLALLNATLLLALLLVLAVWALLGRVQSIAEGIQARANGPIAALAETAQKLEALPDRIDAATAKVAAGDTATAAELAGLRTDVQALTAAVTALPTADGTAALQAAIQQIVADAAGLRPAPAN